MKILHECPQHGESLVPEGNLLVCRHVTAHAVIKDGWYADLLCEYSIPLPPQQQMQASGAEMLWDEEAEA